VAAATAMTDCCGYPDWSSAKSWRRRLRLRGRRRRRRCRHRCIYLLLLSSMYLSHCIVCSMILQRSLRGAEIQSRDDGRKQEMEQEDARFFQWGIERRLQRSELEMTTRRRRSRKMLVFFFSEGRGIECRFACSQLSRQRRSFGDSVPHRYLLNGLAGRNRSQPNPCSPSCTVSSGLVSWVNWVVTNPCTGLTTIMREIKDEHSLWCLAGAIKVQGLGLVGVL
jgi:hypothetical protein